VSASERSPFQAQRDWIVVARIGGDITPRSAAARLSAVDKAEQRGEPCPDIRHWPADAVAATAAEAMPDGWSDSDHVAWLCDRLVHVYGESEQMDFIIRGRAIATRLDGDGDGVGADGLSAEQRDLLHAEQRAWILSRPPAVQQLLCRFPPMCTVRAREGHSFAIPAPGCVGQVVSYLDYPERGSAGVRVRGRLNGTGPFFDAEVAHPEELELHAEGEISLAFVEETLNGDTA
jgi:hypothetical protein